MNKGLYISKKALLSALSNQLKLVTEDETYECMIAVDARELIETFPIVDAIPINWMHMKMTEYVCNRRFSSADLPLVYTLISDWRKECEKDETA